MNLIREYEVRNGDELNSCAAPPYFSDMSPAVPNHRAIAKKAGVALSTVSLALRNDPKVAEKTAARIREVASSMGYSANPGVSNWMAHIRRTRSPRFQESIAYIHTIPPEHSYRRYMPFDLYRSGAAERAARLGYQMRDFEWHSKGMKRSRLRAILQAQGIRGLIFEYSDFEESHQETIDFDLNGFAAISLGAPPADISIHNVSSSYFEGSLLAYRKLAALGYSRIGMSLHMFTDSSLDYEVSGGFICAQSLHPESEHIPVHVIDVVQGWDRKGFCDWFERYRPDVVVSPNREIYEFMQGMGLASPTDVGWANLFKPADSKVAGLDHHPRQIGAASVDLLASLLSLNETGEADFVRRELIEPTWCEGDTVRRVGAPVTIPKEHRSSPMRVYSRNRDWQAVGQDHDSELV